MPEPRTACRSLHSVDLLQTARRVAGRVGVRPRSGQLALVDDEILLTDGRAGEEALEDLPRACRIARLGGQRRSRDVRRHAVVGHGTPGMRLRRRRA